MGALLEIPPTNNYTTVVNMSKYGTSHPQLKRFLRVTCVCKTHSLHALLLHECIYMCFLALHHEHVRKHMDNHTQN